MDTGNELNIGKARRQAEREPQDHALPPKGAAATTAAAAPPVTAAAGGGGVSLLGASRQGPVPERWLPGLGFQTYGRVWSDFGSKPTAAHDVGVQQEQKQEQQQEQWQEEEPFVIEISSSSGEEGEEGMEEEEGPGSQGAPRGGWSEDESEEGQGQQPRPPLWQEQRKEKQQGASQQQQQEQEQPWLAYPSLAWSSGRDPDRLRGTGVSSKNPRHPGWLIVQMPVPGFYACGSQRSTRVGVFSGVDHAARARDVAEVWRVAHGKLTWEAARFCFSAAGYREDEALWAALQGESSPEQLRAFIRCTFPPPATRPAGWLSVAAAKKALSAGAAAARARRAERRQALRQGPALGNDEEEDGQQTGGEAEGEEEKEEVEMEEAEEAEEEGEGVIAGSRQQVRVAAGSGSTHWRGGRQHTIIQPDGTVSKLVTRGMLGGRKRMTFTRSCLRSLGWRDQEGADQSQLLLLTPAGSAAAGSSGRSSWQLLLHFGVLGKEGVRLKADSLRQLFQRLQVQAGDVLHFHPSISSGQDASGSGSNNQGRLAASVSITRGANRKRQRSPERRGEQAGGQRQHSPAVAGEQTQQQRTSHRSRKGHGMREQQLVQQQAQQRQQKAQQQEQEQQQRQQARQHAGQLAQQQAQQQAQPRQQAPEHAQQRRQHAQQAQRSQQQPWEQQGTHADVQPAAAKRARYGPQPVEKQQQQRVQQPGTPAELPRLLPMGTQHATAATKGAAPAHTASAEAVPVLQDVLSAPAAQQPFHPAAAPPLQPVAAAVPAAPAAPTVPAVPRTPAAAAGAALAPVPVAAAGAAAAAAAAGPAGSGRAEEGLLAPTASWVLQYARLQELLAANGVGDEDAQDFKLLLLGLAEEVRRSHFVELQAQHAQGRQALVRRWVAQVLQQQRQRQQQMVQHVKLDIQATEWQSPLPAGVLLWRHAARRSAQQGGRGIQCQCLMA